jgi:hypothetical protein
MHCMLTESRSESLTRSARVCLVTMLLIMAMPVMTGEVKRSVNEENGLQGWHFSDSDIEIELIQRLPDQTRALLMNHKFSREVIEQMALSCMFQTIIRNTGKSAANRVVSIDLTEWRMLHEGKVRKPLMKEPLLDSWTDEDADPAAKLVVRWGMFPTQQEYLPGDYNWGLTAYGIPPGATFDLDVAWREGGALRRGEIKGVVCAPDVDRLK